MLTAVCRPEINTNDQPILGSATSLRRVADTIRNAEIGPWVECIESVVPSVQKGSIHRPGLVCKLPSMVQSLRGAKRGADPVDQSMERRLHVAETSMSSIRLPARH
jgi:hypothetical protein